MRKPWHPRYVIILVGLEPESGQVRYMDWLTFHTRTAATEVLDQLISGDEDREVLTRFYLHDRGPWWRRAGESDRGSTDRAPAS